MGNACGKEIVPASLNSISSGHCDERFVAPMKFRLRMWMERELQTWSLEHALKADPPKAARCKRLVRERFPLGTPMKMCWKSCLLDNTAPYRHYFVTDGERVMEYAMEFKSNCEVAMAENCVEVRQCTHFHKDATIESVFTVDEASKARMMSVAGAGNCSLALRNSEHVARYICTGAWTSMQLLPAAGLGKLLLPRMTSEQRRLLKSPPLELLDPSPAGEAPIYPGEGSYITSSQCRRSDFTAEDQDAFNILVIGPTGSGKSSIINHLFNAKVTKPGSSATSVTRDMAIIEGTATLQTPHLFGSCSRRKVNVVDTVGLCDTNMSPPEAVTLIKRWLKAEKLLVDKVVVVVSGRIPRDHAESIKAMMQWLNYANNRDRFMFVYNKADQVESSAQLQENLEGMARALDIGGVSQLTPHPELGEAPRAYNLCISLGIHPKKASYEEAQKELETLAAPLLCDIEAARVSVDAATCSIL